MNRNIAVIATVLTLAGCGSDPGSTGCRLVGKNLLEDVDFALEAKSAKSPHWAGIQHAGENSFSVSIADAVVSLEKIGTQDWFIYRQRLVMPDFRAQQMAFTADMKLLRPAADAKGRMGKPGGLALSALSSTGRILLRVEQRLAADSQLDEWQKVQLITRLPVHTETVEVGFFHRSEGILQAREPQFRQVDSASEGCVLTPL